MALPVRALLWRSGSTQALCQPLAPETADILKLLPLAAAVLRLHLRRYA